MYLPARYFDDSIETALNIAVKTKFASVSVIWQDRIEVVHMPLTPVASGEEMRFVGHVMRSNPLLEMVQSGAIAAKIVFQPASGYVSPSVYPEKFETGKVVPTWDYVAAHFDAELGLGEPDYTLRQILDLQVGDYETGVGGTWQVADAPKDYMAQMQTAIAGLQFRIKGWKSIKKLSQNKPGGKPAGLPGNCQLDALGKPLISYTGQFAGYCRRTG